MTAEAPVLVTGGAGFIGTNLAGRLLESGNTVRLFDNLSRRGVERNVRWLRTRHGDRLELLREDQRDADAVRAAVRGVRQIYHLAAQVAVTTSLADPALDFDVNARGTLNLLEAARSMPVPPPVLFTSTNKVYGGMSDVALDATGDRYEPVDAGLRSWGIAENRPLDFHSPYGCSKGAAEQYVLDYARTFAIPAVVFRMSCIYGPHQFGTEDQGWVAHFFLAALERRPISVYGDGRQLRDLLFVDDLVDAFLLAQSRMSALHGRVFNVGGGPTRTASVNEVLRVARELAGGPLEVDYRPWRPGDQRYYVSDCRQLTNATGWKPRVGLREGLERLWRWLQAGRPARRARTGGELMLGEVLS